MKIADKVIFLIEFFTLTAVLSILYIIEITILIKIPDCYKYSIFFGHCQVKPKRVFGVQDSPKLQRPGLRLLKNQILFALSVIYT